MIHLKPAINQALPPHTQADTTRSRDVSCFQQMMTVKSRFTPSRKPSTITWLFELLVQAHYQTVPRPQQLLCPNLRVLVKQDQLLVGVVLCVEEGKNNADRVSGRSCHLATVTVKKLRQ